MCIKFKKVVVFTLIFALLLVTAAGCGSSSAQEPVPGKGEGDQEATGATRTITDMAGRTVDVPSNINKVYGTDPIASILLYTVDPDILLGWNYELNEQEKEYILPEYHDLTVFGMGDNVNLEAIIKAAPQICLQASSINEAEIAKADKLQSQLGIPVIIVNGDLDKTSETLQMLGDVLGMTERTEEMRKYVDRFMELAAALEVDGGERPAVYFGNGANSLETAPDGSQAAAVFTLLKADNVAKVESEGARIQITMEQLYAWDPEYIFVSGEPKQNLSGPAAAAAIAGNPDFATLQAVKNGKVYGIPKSPFTWMGRPMSINQMMGLVWVGNLLYPEHFNYDINEEVKNFYHLFYHFDLTDEQVKDIFTK